MDDKADDNTNQTATSSAHIQDSAKSESNTTTSSTNSDGMKTPGGTKTKQKKTPKSRTQKLPKLSEEDKLHLEEVFDWLGMMSLGVTR